MKKIKYYTVYLNENDQVVASGTASECAKQMNKSLNGFHSMVSKNTLGIQNKYCIISEEVFIDSNGNIIEVENE